MFYHEQVEIKPKQLNKSKILQYQSAEKINSNNMITNITEEKKNFKQQKQSSSWKFLNTNTGGSYLYKRLKQYFEKLETRPSTQKSLLLKRGETEVTSALQTNPLRAEITHVWRDNPAANRAFVSSNERMIRLNDHSYFSSGWPVDFRVLCPHFKREFI